MAGVRFLHLLLIPVDASMHLLTYDEVEHLLEALEPRVVIPMHYLIPGLTDPESTLGPVEPWLGAQPRPVRRIPRGEVPLSRESLPLRGRSGSSRGSTGSAAYRAMEGGALGGYEGSQSFWAMTRVINSSFLIGSSISLSFSMPSLISSSDRCQNIDHSFLSAASINSWGGVYRSIS